MTTGLQTTWPDGTPKSFGNAFDVPPVGAEKPFDLLAEEARRAKVREKTRARRERLRKDPFAVTDRASKILRVNPTSNIAKAHGVVQAYRNR